MLFISFILIIIALLNLFVLGRPIHPIVENIKPFISKPISYGLIIASFVLNFLGGLFFLADGGSAYALQSPTGQTWKVTGSGYKPLVFSKKIKIDKEIVIKNLKPEHYTAYKEGVRPEGEEVYVVAANWGEFTDKIPAALETTVIIDVNPDHEDFVETALKSKSESNIVYSRLLPLINEASSAVQKLMPSEQYISGGKVQLANYFQDQLENGLYQLEEYPLNSNIRDSLNSRSRLSSSADGKSVATGYRIKMINGQKARVKGKEGFSTFGFNVRLATIETQQWSPKFEEYLEELLQIEAKSQKDKSAAKAARFEAEKEEAIAKSNIIRERGVKETEQVSVLIQAETAAKQAAFKAEEERNLLEAAQIAKDRITIEAANITKVKKAGIDPVIELRMRLESKEKVAKAIFGGQAFSNLQTSLGGGNGNGGVGAGEYLQYLLSESVKK